MRKKHQRLGIIENDGLNSVSVASSVIQTLTSTQASPENGHGSLIASLVGWLHPVVISDLFLLYSL